MTSTIALPKMTANLPKSQALIECIYNIINTDTPLLELKQKIEDAIQELNTIVPVDSVRISTDLVRSDFFVNLTSDHLVDLNNSTPIIREFNKFNIENILKEITTLSNQGNPFVKIRKRLNKQHNKLFNDLNTHIESFRYKMDILQEIKNKALAKNDIATANNVPISRLIQNHCINVKQLKNRYESANTQAKNQIKSERNKIQQLYQELVSIPFDECQYGNKQDYLTKIDVLIADAHI